MYLTFFIYRCDANGIRQQVLIIRPSLDYSGDELLQVFQNVVDEFLACLYDGLQYRHDHHPDHLFLHDND